MTDPVKSLVEAGAEFDQITVDLESTVGKTRSAALEMIVENTELKQQLASALAALENALEPEETVPTLPPDPGGQVETVLKPLFSDQGENKGWGDAVFIASGTTEYSLSDRIITCGGRSGIINHMDTKMKGTFERLVVVQGPYPTGWGITMSKFYGSITDCTFAGLGLRLFTATQNLTDGHPIYLRVDGDVTLKGNVFTDCGGNTQIAARPWEAPVPDSMKTVVENCHWSNCSWNPAGHGGGGSSNLAMYHASKEGTELLIKDCSFSSTVNYKGTAGAKQEPSARGAIAIWNEAGYYNPKAEEKGIEPDQKAHFSRVTIEDCLIRTTTADRPLIIIDGAREIYIKSLEIHMVDDNELAYPAIQIDDKDDSPQKAKRVKIDPIDHPGVIKFRGESYPLNQGLDWIEEGYLPEA
jgi:hypothetical protein